MNGYSTTTTEAAPEAKVPATADLHGDPLPAGALARLGTTRWRHGANVTFVAFGSDGNTLITAGQDDTIRLWDMATGKEIRRFARPKSAGNNPAPVKLRGAVLRAKDQLDAQTPQLEVKKAPSDAPAKPQALEAVNAEIQAKKAQLEIQAKQRAMLRGDRNGLLVAVTPH